MAWSSNDLWPHVLLLWEAVVRLYDEPGVILPVPTAIAAAFAANASTLWTDFVQSVVKGSLSASLTGSVAASAVALLANRSTSCAKGCCPR